MSYDKKIESIMSWLMDAGLHKEAAELADLLAGSNDAELSSKIRKLKIERARMLAVSGAANRASRLRHRGKNFTGN